MFISLPNKRKTLKTVAAEFDICAINGELDGGGSDYLQKISFTLK